MVEELAASEIDLVFSVVSTAIEDTSRGRALKAALLRRAPVHRVSEAALHELAATDTPQGVLSVARTPDAALDDVIGRPGHLLVADAVQDPGNLGTLVRIADAFAAAGVVLLPGTVDAWNPKVVRASAGSSFHLPIVDSGIDALVGACRRAEVRLIGADAGGTPIAKSDAGRVALIVGNEGAGLTETVRAALDKTVSIAMPGNAESLNVAVAAGILFYLITVRE